MIMPRSEPSGAEEALASIMRGEVEKGFALYHQILNCDHLTHIPVGLHLAFLEQAGRADEASRLRRLAVKHGANLALQAGFLGAEPAVAAEEFEALFASGVVNSRMIYEHLKVLATLGSMEKHSRLMACDELLRLTTLDRPAPNTLTGTLAAAVDEMLLELEHKAERQDAVQSVRHMSTLCGLAGLSHPAANALTLEIAKETETYLRDWSGSNHPLAHLVPASFEISAWGLISRGEGHNTPHIHANGWATGVFYPRSVKGRGGELVIGRPEKAAGTEADWGARRVMPEAGLLVLMPSYYTHWTVPLQRSGLRTSVAFDVLPR